MLVFRKPSISRRTLPLILGLILMAVLLLTVNRPTEGKLLPPKPAPEFTQTDADAWINSKPLHMADLRGKVVLLDIWTFECWNCYRSFPWMNAVEKKYAARGLRVIGIHSPEFEHEKSRIRIEQKMDEFKLHHPVMIDNDFGYWNALGNRFWPAFYLIDKQGQLRALFGGETHAGDRQARAIEAQIEALLDED